MSVVPLQYRSADLASGATAPRRRSRVVRVALWTLAADAVFAASLLATFALRGMLG
jgi:hypothetical protein